MPTLRRQTITAPGLPQGRPPEGLVFRYSLARSADGAPFYVGQTQQAPADRLARHVSLARHRAGKNRRLEARIRRMAEEGDELVMRVEGMYPAGDKADAAERACIAEWRAKLGAALLNQDSGGERTPAGRLVSTEKRRRARLARRGTRRETSCRRNQPLACSRRNHAPAALNALRAYLAAPPRAARDHGLDGRCLQEAVRGRERGIPEALACAVGARMDEGFRLRDRALGHRATRVDRWQLRWLLTAYARPGSLLTLAAIAARLGITQGAVSHLLAGRKGRPLPRQLLRACRARARAGRHGAYRAGGVQ
jgi:hypothetical protein